MREVLLSRIRTSGAKAPRIPSPYSGFFITLAFKRTAVFAAVLLVVVGSAGGVSLAAEGSVPGETIYVLKVNVNEPLYSLTAVTPSAKAAVATSRAERRLKEAEVLAARGSLDESAVEELSERFTDSAEEASLHIEDLAQDDSGKATNASVELESVLSAHGRILDDIIAARNGDTALTLATLRTDVALREEETLRTRDEGHLALLTGEGARKTSAHVLKEVEQDAEAELRGLTERSGTLHADDALALDSRVAFITEALDEGKAKHERGAYRDAVADFTRAKTALGVGWRLLEAKDRFETDEEVREEVALSEEVAQDVAEVATMSAPVAMKMEATTTATTTATSTEPEPFEESRESGTLPRPIRIHLDP